MISARLSDSEKLNATMGSDPDSMSAHMDGLLNPGPPGITPTIGENGNWFLGDTDTGKPSRGETGATGPQGPKGDTGSTGQPGPKGDAGKSAYQYALDGGYTGTEAQFAAKLAAEMPTTLPNPNALTFTGAATGTYDGSAPLSVNIPSAVTDDHINSLIDTKLVVIENGAY